MLQFVAQNSERVSLVQTSQPRIKPVSVLDMRKYLEDSGIANYVEVGSINEDLLKQTMNFAFPEGVIVVCGSLFVAAEVRRCLIDNCLIDVAVNDWSKMT